MFRLIQPNTKYNKQEYKTYFFQTECFNKSTGKFHIKSGFDFWSKNKHISLIDIIRVSEIVFCNTVFARNPEEAIQILIEDLLFNYMQGRGKYLIDSINTLKDYCNFAPNSEEYYKFLFKVLIQNTGNLFVKIQDAYEKNRIRYKLICFDNMTQKEDLNHSDILKIFKKLYYEYQNSYYSIYKEKITYSVY